MTGIDPRDCDMLRHLASDIVEIGSLFRIVEINLRICF